MTPQQFIHKWGPGGTAFKLNEEQGAQSHFLDLCDLLDVPKPGSEAGYLFEEKNSVIGGAPVMPMCLGAATLRGRTRRLAKACG